MGTGVRKPCLASTQPLALCATLEGAWPSLPLENPLTVSIQGRLPRGGKT